MIDFTHCEVNKYRAYGGANGNKINIIYNNEGYMLKFPPVAKQNKDMSYSNSCISEYVSCHILETMGFDVQSTLLGTYTDKKGKEKVVVACKDFVGENEKLIEFAHLKNTCIDSEQNGYGKNLDSILLAIKEQDLLPEEEIVEFFWDLFIADALLGNFDRHNGNWGFLVNEKNQSAKICPVYDMGSCLFPQLEAEDMTKVLEDENEINKRIYTFPRSAIEIENKKLSYIEYISSMENDDCTNALKRVYDKINLDEITKVIDETPYINDTQKEFYKIMVSERYDKILSYCMDLVLAQEQNYEMKW